MSTPLALEGMKVIDCTQVLAGPVCTMMLADMGAEVIKIEKPQGGDDTRRMGPPFVDGESAAFLMLNRNKRSIVLDLKHPRGMEVLKALVKGADVFIQNFRPGTMERLGMGYEDARALNPGIIYCTISGFGSTGPYKARAGFDLVTQGMSGLMSINGPADGPPTKIGVPLTDLGAGMLATYGILCAYAYKLKTGQGQLVDTSLLEAGIAYTVWESGIFFATGQAPGRTGSVHRLTAPYQPFQTSDGYINIGAASQATWERLCRAMGREDLLEDPRFATNADRMRNLDALTEELQSTFLTDTSQRWLERLEEAGVPCGPIYDMAQVYADPQVQARQMMLEFEHPKVGRFRNIGIPVKLSATPGRLRRPVPTLGQHTDEVLRELGYTEEDIASLREDGAIR